METHPDVFFSLAMNPPERAILHKVFWPGARSAWLGLWAAACIKRNIGSMLLERQMLMSLPDNHPRKAEATQRAKAVEEWLSKEGVDFANPPAEFANVLVRHKLDLLKEQRRVRHEQ